MQDNIQLLKEKYSLSDEELQELDALIKSTQNLKDSNKIYNNKIRKTLQQYSWVIPYGMEYDELNFLLKETKSQKEFTNELLKYFTDDIINDIFDKIINMEIQQHIDIINQIRKSYFDNCFSLINCSIIALIDFNLMFYLKDKRNLKRQRLVSELAIKIGKESGYFLSKYELYIVLDFIKELFHPEDFNRIEFNQELLLN